MPINFCCLNFVTISSGATSFENHELKNLVAQKGIKTKTGFIADYYVKAPISVDLKFICHMNLSYILIKTFIGRQRSVSFEISTKPSQGTGKVSTILDAHDYDYIILHKFGDESFPERWKTLDRCLKVAFNCPYRLKNIQEVSIGITKTAGSSVPCLGLLEVWGDPSPSVKKDFRLKLKNLWESYLKSFEETPVQQIKVPFVSDEIKTKSTDSLNVPEEFIDPITYDIMLFPMILPSGKIVDQSTLNKFFSAEEEFGRGQSDPFTGVPFSNERKPFLNVILKTKIDKYLVENSNLDFIKNMPRILGKSPSTCVPGLIQPNVAVSITSEVQPSSSSSKIVDSSSNKTVNTHSDFNSIKRTKRSLDELISDSLSGLPSYLEVKTPKLSPKEDCSICRKASLLFKLPCSHFICRECLLKIELNSSCSICQRCFTRNEPVRYHSALQ